MPEGISGVVVVVVVGVVDGDEDGFGFGEEGKARGKGKGSGKGAGKVTLGGIIAGMNKRVAVTGNRKGGKPQQLLD